MGHTNIFIQRAELNLNLHFFFVTAFVSQSKASQDKAASKREERLLMSSVYELGMDIIERQLKSSVSELCVFSFHAWCDNRVGGSVLLLVDFRRLLTGLMGLTEM